MEFERLFFFSQTPSLLDIVSGLWSDEEPILAIIVAGFSIVFPMVKLLLVGEVFKAGGKVEGLASILSKWSMTDVLLVAIVVFAAKTSGMASAATQPGIWFYGLSGIFVAIASLIKDRSN